MEAAHDVEHDFMISDLCTDPIESENWQFCVGCCHYYLLPNQQADDSWQKCIICGDL
jgi:hypothetical protein